MFCCSTHNLSNLLVLLYELALGASGHDPHCGAFRWLSSPGVALSMTLCIYVTHLIYAFVLLPTAHRRDDQELAEGALFLWECLRTLYYAGADGAAMAAVAG